MELVDEPVIVVVSLLLLLLLLFKYVGLEHFDERHEVEVKGRVDGGAGLLLLLAVSCCCQLVVVVSPLLFSL